MQNIIVLLIFILHDDTQTERGGMLTVRKILSSSRLRHIKHLYRSQHGVTIIEFALIAPTLMLILLGIIELSLISFSQHVMESSIFSASRLGKTGYIDNGTTQQDTILNTLNDQAGTFLDITKITIQTSSYSKFDQIGLPEPFVDANLNGIRDEGENYTDVNGNAQYDADMGTPGFGHASDVVVYTITYPWPIFTPLISQFIGNDGILNLTARAVVQNEPY